MKHVKEEHRNNWLYGGVARQEYLEIEEEVRENPPSRSAKLRIAKRINKN